MTNYLVHVRSSFGRWLAILVLTVLGSQSLSAAVSDNYTRYVNPWIGTGGHGHVFLGANVPFGFVQLGPTEHTRGWDWCSGYHIQDSVLIGFGHTHLSGTGIGDLGDIGFLPVGHANQTETVFSHRNEYVCPGYYCVKLQDPNVFVELTATQRVGFQRYMFGGNVSRDLVRLDLKQGIGWDALSQSALQLENDTTITGMRRSKGWANDQYVYFVAHFSKPVSVVKREGDTILVLSVSAPSEPLMIKTALSAVSVADAKANMAAELPGWDFNATVAAANRAWNDELGRVKITTADSTARTIFYTALYHLMVAPSVFSDVSGRYRGADGKVHQGDFTNYTTFSLWDTYRAAFPLMTLIYPDMMHDMAQTFLHIYEQQGKLPVWHLMGNETDCMVGNPGIPVLADLCLKGYLNKAEEEKAFEAMNGSAMRDERGMNLLKKYGYLPYDIGPEYESVSKGLEYALADACVAQVAKKLGKTADYKYFLERSKAYKRYFDPRTHFMRPLDSKGNFRTPFNPFSIVAGGKDDYTEGNAWQYTWLVPHDVKGLVKLFGGKAPFVSKLDSLFIVHGDLGNAAPPDVSGLMGQYAHGNEPSHHIIYMYNYIGQPWKAARLLRTMLSRMYADKYDGLAGNEDVGQMSAWYILTSLGLYQVEPAGGKFIIGSPIFDESEMNVGDGKTFTIKTINNSDKNIYVQRATLNGKPYTKSYILYRDIKKGGTLVLTMGDKPSDWGTRKQDLP